MSSSKQQKIVAVKLLGDSNVEEDLLYAKLPIYKKRIKQAREYVSRCLAASYKPCVSFSGGKDSSVLLSMVIEQRPDAMVVMYDSGAEFPETFDIIEQTEKRLGITIYILEPEMSMLELKAYADVNGPIHISEYKRVLIEDPSRRIATEYGCDMFFIGLRKQESNYRLFALARMKEPYYYSEKMKFFMAYPLMNLKGEDVYAYIAESRLPLHPYYTDPRIHLDRNLRRVSGWAGDTASSQGRWLWLKFTHPELYERLYAADERAGWYI